MAASRSRLSFASFSENGGYPSGTNGSPRTTADMYLQPRSAVRLTNSTGGSPNPPRKPMPSRSMSGGAARQLGQLVGGLGRLGGQCDLAGCDLSFNDRGFQN